MSKRQKELRDFTVSYIGSVLGEAVTLQDENIYWAFPEAGNYAASVDDSGAVTLWEDAFPLERSDMQYRIIGYCASNDIKARVI